MISDVLVCQDTKMLTEDILLLNAQTMTTKYLANGDAMVAVRICEMYSPFIVGSMVL